MTKRKIVAIDAKELADEHLKSLGYSLLEVIPNLNAYDLILLSDIEIPDKYVPRNARVIIRGKKYTGGADLLKYQLWMKHQMIKLHVDCYYQINHFSLIHTKDIKQIVVVHDLYPLEKIEKYSFIQRLTYFVSMIGTMINANRIFTVSNFTKNRLEHYLWKSDKIEVNYDGVDAPPHIDSLDSFSCVEGPFCLMLGRVNHYKGTMRVVTLFDKYLSDCGYKLVIAGQAETEDVISKMNEITGRNSNIIWLNYVDNNTKEWLLRNCSLMIYASRYDGFGVPPLEAAIRRKKVILNDIEVLREISKNSGKYIDFNSSDEAVIKAIMDSLSDNDEKKIEAMYNIAKQYTWKHFVDKIVNAIEGSVDING